MAREFRLVRPPFFTLFVIVILVSMPIGLGVAWIGDLREGGRFWPGLILTVVAYVVLGGAVLLVRRLLRPKTAPVIELHDAHMVLPLSSRSGRSRTVPYSELRSLNVFGRGRWARLLLATSRRHYVYVVNHFEHGVDAVIELRAVIRQRIAAQPGGLDQLRGIDDRDRHGANVLRNPPRVSFAILAILVAAYLWTRFAGALDTPFGLVAYGANVPLLVRGGEWYRLFSANFLHINLLHLYLNGFGILVLGMLLERLIGPWRFLAIYLISGVAGAAASTYASLATLSVGASTAVFGLLGALALINWRFRKTLPGGFGQPLRWWIIILGINGALPIFIPAIDWAAHVGGFAAGVVLAAILCRDEQSIAPKRTAPPWIKATAVAVSVVCVVALGEAVSGARAGSGADEARLTRAFVAQRSVSPVALNTVAWNYAIDPNVSRAELALAEDAAERAVAVEPENPALIDTLATVYYRQRDYDRAVQTERRALELDDRRVFMSQIGRFLAAHLTDSGAVYSGGAGESTVRVSVDRPAGNEEDWAIVVELAHDVEDGLEVIALDRGRGARLIGTLRIQIGAGVEAGRYRFVPDSGLLKREWPATELPIVALVDASGCGCTSGAIRGRYFSMDSEVAGLP